MEAVRFPLYSDAAARYIGDFSPKLTSYRWSLLPPQELPSNSSSQLHFLLPSRTTRRREGCLALEEQLAGWIWGEDKGLRQESETEPVSTGRHD